MYKNIKKLTEDVDSDTSFLLFTSTLFNASTTYFVVTAWLHPQDYIIPVQKVSLIFLFGLSCIACGMSVSASFVNEASAEVANEVQRLLSNGKPPTAAQKQLVFVTQKELFLTVWKMIPIRRSLILVTMGTIFTYCILIDNLKSPP